MGKVASIAAEKPTACGSGTQWISIGAAEKKAWMLFSFLLLFAGRCYLSLLLKERAKQETDLSLWRSVHIDFLSDMEF